MRKVIVLIFIFTQLSFNIFSQIAELKVNKKKSISIQLATSLGLVDIPDGYYGSGDSLYFIFEPKGDWEFSKGDKKDFLDVRIIQSGIIVPASNTYAYYGSNKNISKIKVTYPKNSINITKQFEFTYEKIPSDIFSIKEQYWPYYPEFNRYFDKGKQLNNEKKYVEAFKELENILPGYEHNQEFSRFSTYDRAYEELLPEVVSNYQAEQELELNNLKSELENKDILADDLQLISENIDSLTQVKNLFEPFYIINESQIIDLKEKHNEVISDYEEFYNVSYDVWSSAVLKIIEDGSYKNESKFEVFVELLSRVLIYTNSVERLSKFDSINISLISNPKNDIPFFKKYIVILDEMKWKSEFITVVELLNEQLRNNSYMLSQTHLTNLMGKKSAERQPNYYIINAFNELAKEHFGSFRDNIHKGIEKCTDLDIMYYLELWNYNDRFKNMNVDDKFIETINSGLAFENSVLPDKAIQEYDKAARLEDCALPKFLIGKIKLDINNERNSAERYFYDAINLYRDFVLARIYHIEIRIDNNELTDASNEIEAVLKMPSLQIWYIYYLKAKVLMKQNNLKGALNIVENSCKPLISNNFEQYILLGDIYLELKDCVKSKENYQSAGDMEKDNKTYSDSMDNLRKICK